eukprot:m.104344 g.104344  ORF g.104344 m.104344 type:complete len:50 (-) comp13258_c0_seq4:172-321(-)
MLDDASASNKHAAVISLSKATCLLVPSHTEISSVCVFHDYIYSNHQTLR